MLNKYFTIIPVLAMTCFVTDKTYGTEVLTDIASGDHKGFHSFHSPSIAVYAHELPAKDVRSIVIQLEDFSDDSLDDELDVLARTSYSLDLSYREDLNHAHLRKVAQVPLVKGLNLEETYLDNTGLGIISTMSLRFLDITRNRFDDEGMPFVARLGQLEELIMRANKVTPKGIAHVVGLDKLRILDASCTYLENPGIQTLTGCKNLETLKVRACGFDDAALSYFLTIPTLRFLDISGNKLLTLSGIQNFLSQKRDELIVKYDQ